MKNRGMVLLTALLFLMVMLLMVSSNLFISQLSMKSAEAAQQQFQLEYRALTQHLLSLATLDEEDISAAGIDLPACPGIYAAWSNAELQCELLLHETTEQSDTVPIYTRYNSMLLRKRIQLPEVPL